MAKENSQRSFIITGKTNAKTKILWKFTLFDLFVIGLDFVIFGIMIFVMLKMGAGTIGIVLPIVIGLFIAIMVIPINEEQRVYNYVAKLFRYIFRNKKIEKSNISITFDEDGTVKNRTGLLSAIVEIDGKNMLIMSEQKKNLNYVALENVLRTIKNGKIIKADKLKSFRPNIKASEERITLSKDEIRKKGNELDKEIFEELDTSLIMTNGFYFIIYDNNKESLRDKVDYTISNLGGHRLNKEQTIQFYRDFYLDYREDEEIKKDLTSSSVSKIEKKKPTQTYDQKVISQAKDNLVYDGVSKYKSEDRKEMEKKLAYEKSFINRTVKFFKKLFGKKKKEVKPMVSNEIKQEVKVEPKKEISEEQIATSIRFPKMKENKKSVLITYGKSDEEIDRKVEYTFISIYSMPLLVYGCFLAPLFQVKGVYVNINFNIDEDLDRINKRVNKRINTIMVEGDKVKNETQRLKMSEEIEVLQSLIRSLNSGVSSTSLLNVDITLKIPSEMKDLIKKVKTMIKLNMSSLPIDNKYEQLDTYISMLPQNLSCLKSAQIDMTSDTLGGGFPFHTDEFYEPTGDVLGNSENGDYFSFDLFYNLNNKDAQNRTNSNMVIIGKSGAGKSYFSKLILKNYLLQNCKVLILDPENEYEYICKKFSGETLDMSKQNAVKINPFEFVYLDDEDENPLTTHLEFLRQFFKITISDLGGMAREELDVLTTATYKYKGITSGCDFRKLKSKDFPTFDDLIAVTKKRLKAPNLRDSELDALTEIKIALEKFEKDGIYGRLWNCYTTFNITNDFTTFNFRGLDNAHIIKNATMLLVTNMINKVLIENISLKGKRKLIFMVDEAHTFIDPNFPVALDLMKNMSKRIRKYNGSLITTTQNIQDFVGFDTNTRTKATAVLNNSQYTCLFGLKPNDLEEVLAMYSQGSVGDFTDEEQNYLLTAKRGDALMIIDTDHRVPFHASVKSELEVEYFLPSYQKNN